MLPFSSRPETDHKHARPGRPAAGPLVASLLAGLLLLLLPAVAWAAPEPPRYRVQAGDTLTSIAEAQGTTVPAILAANVVPDPDLITVGQTLIVPAAAAPLVRVEVQPGDTWGSIAHRYHSTVETIRELNGLADAQHLWVGQDLFLPADPAQPSPALPEGPVTAIETRPQPAAQGETVEVRVEVGDQVAYCPAAESCIDLDLRLGDQAIPLLPDGPDRYWGLIAIHPLTGPGYVWLDLSWRRETGSPDTGAIRWPVPVADGDYPTYDIVLPPGKGDLLDPELVQAEFEKLQALWGAPETPVAWQRRFQRPISEDYLTSAPFGQRRSYNSGPVTSYHSGQDFAAPEGAEVHAPAPGTVVLAEPLLVRGNAVVIDHGAGVFSGYWHLSSIAVTAGQQVNTGDLLGLVGTTGLSTGNHLHWELRLHSVPVSPLQWVDTRFP